jgi:simple sugar transport system substrate-binding protein
MKDNKGKEIVAGGKAYAEDAIELESMDYLVEGVVGSTA